MELKRAQYLQPACLCTLPRMLLADFGGLEDVILSHNYTLNEILPTMFSLQDKGKIFGLMSSNVDDLLYGSLPDPRHLLGSRKGYISPFMFCGKAVAQHEDYSITVTAPDNTEKIRAIAVVDKRRGIDKFTAEKTTCLRSVVGALSWLARQVRPGLSY